MLQTKEEVRQWLIEMGINGCAIYKDLSVSCFNDVNLSKKNLKEIPIKFNIVRGRFICNDNQLTSFEGMPNKVEKEFSCEHNLITSLEGMPECDGSIYLGYNQITSLKGMPKKVKGGFSIQHNLLTSLEFCPTEVEGIFSCNDNQLTSFKYAPKKIRDELNCENNLFNPLLDKFIKKMVIGDKINFSIECDTNNDLGSYVETGYYGDQYISMKQADFNNYLLTYKLVTELPTTTKTNQFKI